MSKTKALVHVDSAGRDFATHTVDDALLPDDSQHESMKPPLALTPMRFSSPSFTNQREASKKSEGQHYSLCGCGAAHDTTKQLETRGKL